MLTEEGVYKAQVLSWGLGKAATGTFQFSLSVKVVAKAIEDDPSVGLEELTAIRRDDDGNDTEVPAPIKRTVFLYLSPKTKDRTLAALKSLGYPHDTLKAEALNAGNVDSHDFAKSPIFVECHHEEYRGKDKEKWELARQPRKELDRESLDQFNNLFGPITAEDLDLAIDGHSHTEDLEADAVSAGVSEPEAPPAQEEEVPPSKSKRKES